MSEGLAATGSEKLAGEGCACPTAHGPKTGGKGSVKAGNGGPARLAACPRARHRAPPQALAPSALGGEKVVAGETDALSAEAGKARAARRCTCCCSICPVCRRRRAPVWPKPFCPTLCYGPMCWPGAGDTRLLSAPAPVFAPGSLAEAAFAASFRGLPLTGSIDRLVVTGDHVLAVDYKSNRLVPKDPARCPRAFCANMGAYAHALERFLSGPADRNRDPRTRTTLMPLDPDIVRAALHRTAIP